MGKPLRELIRRTLFRGKGNLVSMDDPYERMCRLLAGHAVTGIVDAGASDARVSRRLLERFPQATAYAFEPHPAYRDKLTEAQRQDRRIQPQFAALSDAAGSVDFYETKWLGQTSRFAPNERLGKLHPHTKQQNRLTVQAVSLDDWWRRQGEPAIQLIKMDIQAGELLALRGAADVVRRDVLLIYTEVYFNPMHDGGATLSEIDAFLRPLGFVLYNLYRLRSDVQDMLVCGNAIFVHEGKLGL